MRLINKLVKHFEAKSIIHLFIIFVVFGISGSATLFLTDPIIKFVHYLNWIENNFLLLSIRILLIFLIYQIVLIFTGYLFGEFSYFYNFEKKMLKKIINKFK